jgi:putative protease
MPKIPELLAPAGTLKNMRYAFAYGADAVYAGLPRYSLRVRNNDFNTLEQLTAGIHDAHRQNKQFYLACNIFPHNAKLKTFLQDMRPIIACQPDALIMADPGLILWVREHFPDMPIHLSVQSNTVNYATVKFWKTIGLTRVILSRELSLDEIAEIRQQCPEMELEVFVHGALCIAYSGRCLLSGYLNHRDANQGSCTNACRWNYRTMPAVETVEDTIEPVLGRGKPAAGMFLLEEAQRPGELLPMFEDEHGTYILNSKDLRAVQHIERLVNIGIDSLKIEGRTKSFYYVARTTQVYRQAIDDAVNLKSFDKQLMNELENMSNRGYTEGFYRRHVHDEYQNYIEGSSQSTQQQFVGEIMDFDPTTQLARIDVKNHFAVGDTLELLLPKEKHRFTLDYLTNLQSEPITVAPGSGHVVYARLPTTSLINMGLLVKALA